jgi:PleD family two-component response regulator
MSKNVIAVVDDLFFASKIRGAAQQAGVPIIFGRSVDAVLEAVRRDPASLIIVDLHTQKVDPLVLASRLKGDDQTRSVPLIGFFSHVQVELQREATDAGFDQVMPRSAFVKRLNEILSTDYADYTDKNLDG